ncbi:MAG: hypothetical protein ACFFA4_05665 [Promethearchaeota archaeon]
MDLIQREYMQNQQLKSIIFRVVNCVLIFLTFFSWLMITSLNWNVPEYIRTLWIKERDIYDPVISDLFIMSMQYILNIFVPYFTLFLISVIGFFFINAWKGKIKYLEELLMKITFYSVILTSIIYIIVLNTPLPPPQELPLLFYGYIRNREVMQFYFTLLSVIGVILIIIAIIGLHIMSEFNKKREIELLILKI